MSKLDNPRLKKITRPFVVREFVRLKVQKLLRFVLKTIFCFASFDFSNRFEI
jgi:hypothetical protein